MHESSRPPITAFGKFRDAQRIGQSQPLHHQRSSITVHGFPCRLAAYVLYGQDYAPGGAQLLQYLISQAQIPEYQVRFRWKPNSVAFWDNRATQHYAVMEYPPCHRKMERAGIKDEATF